MPKQYDKYTYNDKQYIFIEYLSEQKEDGRIVEQVKLIEENGDCIAFYLKKFFNENFTKVEITKKEKKIIIRNTIVKFIASSFFTVLIFTLIGFGLYIDVKHYANTEALLKEKNVCENVQNAIMKSNKII